MLQILADYVGVTLLCSYTEGVAAKVLLPCEPLATHGTGEGPLSCVATDVSLHDSLLLGSVRAERTLVEFHWHYQNITCRGGKRPAVQIYLERATLQTVLPYFSA